MYDNDSVDGRQMSARSARFVVTKIELDAALAAGTSVRPAKLQALRGV